MHLKNNLGTYLQAESLKYVLHHSYTVLGLAIYVTMYVRYTS